MAPAYRGAMSRPFHVAQVNSAQAWAMLAGAATMMTLAMGMRQNLGLFQAPASRELGIAVSDFALAISVQQVAWGLSQPFAGALTDRYGTRWVAITGCLLFVVGVWLTAGATNTADIVLGAGICIGIALSCTTSGVTANIAARVVEPGRRTLAFGIVSAAGSVGTLAIAPLAAFILAADGWRAALWAFVIVALAMLPAAWVGSRADRLPNSVPADKDLTLWTALGEARRHTGYVVMAAAFFVFWLGDRYPKRLLLGGLYIARSATLALFFMFPPTPLTVILFGIAMGVLWLGVIPLVNGLVVQIFGLRFLSTLTGIAFLSHQAGSFLGAWGGGYIFDLMGSYDLAWKIGVLIGLIAGTAQLLMDDRPTARLAAQPA